MSLLKKGVGVGWVGGFIASSDICGWECRVTLSLTQPTTGLIAFDQRGF
ncbi:MAG: hypothetical protein ACOH2K_15670 [Burkholderiaceae bacterium]